MPINLGLYYDAYLTGYLPDKEKTGAYNTIKAVLCDDFG